MRKSGRRKRKMRAWRAVEKAVVGLEMGMKGEIPEPVVWVNVSILLS